MEDLDERQPLLMASRVMSLPDPLTHLTCVSNPSFSLFGRWQLIFW